MIDFSHVRHGNEMLGELLKSPSVVPLDVLENELHLSRRSILYVIKQVNKELIIHNLYEIENIRGIGYLLPDETRQQLTRDYQKDDAKSDFGSFFKNYPKFGKLSKEQRQLTEVFFLISRDTTSLNQLTSIFNTSKNTVIKDLKELETTLPKELQIQNFKSGKSIVGDETVQRSWVFEHFQALLNVISPFFHPTINTQISKHLQQFEKATGNTLTDDSTKTLNSYLQWLLTRLSNKKYRLKEDKDGLDNSFTYDWANKLLKDYDIKNQNEAQYLSKIVNTQAFQHINLNSPLIKKIRPITAKVISLFNQKAGVKLPTEVGSLNENLTVHLASTYCRVKFNIRYYNPLLERMKTNYRETFELTRLAITPFNEFVHSQLSDDEIALITAYFSGAMRSSSQTALTPTNPNEILVVCSSGIGTSQLLLTQLRQRYPNVGFVGPYNIFQYENCSLENVKFVISTTTLPQKNCPILTVSVIPNDSDWEHIDYQLQNAGFTTFNLDNSFSQIKVSSIMDIISNYARIVDPQGLEQALKTYFKKPTTESKAGLQDPLLEKHVRLVRETMDWESAVRFSMTPLVEDSTIQPRYIDQIIKLTKDHGDYMAIGKGIFLAHASFNAGVNRLGANFTYFKKPFRIDGSKKDINFIVGVAPVDQKQHLNFLANLLQCVQDDGWLSKLHQVQTERELQNLLVQGHLIAFQ